MRLTSLVEATSPFQALQIIARWNWKHGRSSRHWLEKRMRLLRKYASICTATLQMQVYRADTCLPGRLPTSPCWHRWCRASSSAPPPRFRSCFPGYHAAALPAPRPPPRAQSSPEPLVQYFRTPWRPSLHPRGPAQVRAWLRPLPAASHPHPHHPAPRRRYPGDP